MIFWIVGWIALWRFRSWEMLGTFTLIYAVLQVAGGYLSASQDPQAAGMGWPALLLAIAINAAIYTGIFAAVGAIIVATRGGKLERNPSEKEIDAELARVRAEVAAREGNQTK